jgi:hypothetical protein
MSDDHDPTDPKEGDSADKGAGGGRHASTELVPRRLKTDELKEPSEDSGGGVFTSSEELQSKQVLDEKTDPHQTLRTGHDAPITDLVERASINDKAPAQDAEATDPEQVLDTSPSDGDAAPAPAPVTAISDRPPGIEDEGDDAADDMASAYGDLANSSVFGASASSASAKLAGADDQPVGEAADAGLDQPPPPDEVAAPALAADDVTAKNPPAPTGPPPEETTEPRRRAPPPIAGGREPPHNPPPAATPSASAARDFYDYGSLDRVSFMTRFLWFCAGADAQLLMRCPNSDRVKFQGIGGVVLTVGVLAFLSGSYAFYTVFSPKDDTALANDLVHYGAVAASVFFGLIWSLIIFNIDRFIISSTGKGDGTEKITWNEFSNALPRLAMALVIGLCMSKPLEIRILQSEIESALEKEQKEFLSDLNDQSEALVAAERKRLRQAIDDRQSRIDSAEDALEKRRVEINEQRKRLEDEASGLLGGKAGRGPAWRDKKRNLDVQEAELSRDRAAIGKKYELWNAELKENKQELEELDDELADAKESNRKVAQHMDGLMKRIQISHDIGGWIPFAIMLLLLCIEAGPIFFKLMVIKGAYDYLEENQKRIVRAYHGIEPDARVIADGKGASVTVDIHHAVAAILEEEKRRLQTEKQLAEEVHEAYREKMADAIQRDPTPFMKE